jgi:hypothetical protein
MLRALLFWLGGLGLLLGLGPEAARTQPSPSPSVRSDTVALSPTGRVDIENSRGRITVTTWDRARVGYEVVFAPGPEDSTAYKMPDIVHSETALSFGGSSSWSIRIPGLVSISPGGSRKPAARYRVVMPETARLKIDDRSSRISVSGVTADVAIESHEGQVVVQDVEGRLSLDTYRDTAHVSGLRGSIALETYSGAIWVDLAALTDESTAETYSGALHFGLPRSAGFTLYTDLTTASLSVDEAFGPPSDGDADTATYNGGGPRLNIESYSGPVEIRPRTALPDSSAR